jgi:hypothetical protein
VQNQFDNWNNSKRERASRVPARSVAVVVAAVALAVLGAALTMPPPLAGRLHPAHVPAAIALLAFAASLTCILRPDLTTSASDAACPPPAAASPRGVVCAVGAIVIIALGTRDLGLLPTVCVAGAAGALGIRGVGVVRACVIGAGLSFVAALLFALLLRQPLPLLPGRW